MSVIIGAAQQVRRPPWVGNPAGGGGGVERLILNVKKDTPERHLIYEQDPITGIWTFKQRVDRTLIGQTGSLCGTLTGDIIAEAGQLPWYYIDAVWSFGSGWGGFGDILFAAENRFDQVWMIGGVPSYRYRWTGESWSAGVATPGNFNQYANFWAASFDEAWLCQPDFAGNAIYHTTDGGLNWTNRRAEIVAQCPGCGGGNAFLGAFGWAADAVYIHYKGGFFDPGCLVRYDGDSFHELGRTPGSHGTPADHMWCPADGSFALIAGNYSGHQIVRWDGSSLTLRDSFYKAGTPTGIYGLSDGSRIVYLGAEAGRESVDGGLSWQNCDASFPGMSSYSAKLSTNWE